MAERAASPILAHYATGYEARRLESGPGQLEHARTRELLLRHLPLPPARVLDVGGGPGVYSRWLVERGYEVTLIDVVPLHVEQAAARLREVREGAARAELGDARALAAADATQDAVLLMGPLYHLQERADRLRALGEARRVLRPGGVLAAVVISRFASLLDGTARLLVRDPAFARLLADDLRDGRHLNATDHPEYFTTAFFHHPDEAGAELRAAGFDDVALTAIEGPFWCLGSFDELWREPALRELMLGALRRIERDPSLLGASAHILATGRKGG